jgi:hypothetical protein
VLGSTFLLGVVASAAGCATDRSLRVTATPANAAVFIDGHPTAPLDEDGAVVVRVPRGPGRHVVSARAGDAVGDVIVEADHVDFGVLALGAVASAPLVLAGAGLGFVLGNVPPLLSTFGENPFVVVNVIGSPSMPTVPLMALGAALGCAPLLLAMPLALVVPDAVVVRAETRGAFVVEPAVPSDAEAAADATVDRAVDPAAQRSAEPERAPLHDAIDPQLDVLLEGEAP